MKIIIVEDEPRTRSGIKKLLEKINPEFKIIGEAANGKEGLDLITGLKPEVVITDIRMPVMDGFEMLKNLKKKNVFHKTIILSSYSEFEYARQAICLGVSEYLLKPITVESLRNILDNIKNELDETHRTPYLLSSHQNIKYIMQNLIIGHTNIMESTKIFLEKQREIKIKGDFLLLHIYSTQNKRNIIKIFQILIGNYKKIQKYFLIELNYAKEIILFISQHKIENIEVYFQDLMNMMYTKGFEDIAISIEPFNDLLKIRETYQNIQDNLKWSISLNKKIISSKLINSLKPEDFVFPQDILNRIKKGLFEKNYNKIENYIMEFIDCSRKKIEGTIYYPDQIINAYANLCSSIYAYIKEIDIDIYNLISKKNIMRKIMNSVSLFELENSLSELASVIKNNRYDNKDSHSINIYKTLNYIKTNYNRCILLNEIADNLNITSEYLSSLFKKEVKKTFTEYLCEYRIDKAKALLINSDLKINLIAAATGFKDIKYFYKVFKKNTGYTPKEFIKNSNISF